MKNGLSIGDVLMFKEHQHPDGRHTNTVSFTDFDICPCTYSELASAKATEPITIKLEVRNARIVESNITGLDIKSRARATATLKSRFTSRAIGLVQGGWLPSSFAANRPNSTIIVDRNVVTEIISRFDGGRKKGRDPDFLDLFADSPIRISPLLYAIEGNGRTFPSPELTRAQLDEVAAKLRAALPKAEIVVGPEVLQGALGLIEESKASFSSKQALLLKLAPLLCAPTARKKVLDRVKIVLSAADRHKVPLQSILILAIISSIAVPNGRSPAFTLLNLKPSYSQEDAYNALSDLRALDLLIQMFAVFTQESLHLCTADRDLALFWCAMQASNFKRGLQSVIYDLSPTEALLPGDTAKVWQDAVAPSNGM